MEIDSQITRLITNLGNANIDEQEKAIESLIEIGEAAVLPLINTVHNENPVISANAIEALGQLGDQRAGFCAGLVEAGRQDFRAERTQLRAVGD